MTRPAQHEPQIAAEGLAKLGFPLFVKQFARHEDQRNFAPSEAVADGTKRRECLSGPRSVLEYAAPAARLPGFER